MREGSLVGNVFLLDKHLSQKSLLFALITTLFIAFFKFILEYEPLSKNLSITEVMYSLIGILFFYIISNWRIIMDFFKKYFVFNGALFLATLFEILLFISIVYVEEFKLYGWIIGSFWLFSGIFRATIQFSKALFISNIDDYLKIIQIFAYSRASYFAIIIIAMSNSIKWQSYGLWVIYFVILGLIDFWFISNLYPYMTKHQNVKNVIDLIRTVKDNKRIKINQLKTITNFSESYFDKILSRLVYGKYIKINNNRVEIGDGYMYIYNA